MAYLGLLNSNVISFCSKDTVNLILGYGEEFG